MSITDVFQRIKGNKTLLNGTLFSLFSFLNRGIGFILLIILARYIMPAEYGRLSLFNTIITLLGFFVALSCQGFLSISYFQRKGELFRQDCTSIILILTVCSIILGIILLFSQKALSRLAELPSLYLWFALIISATQILVNLYTDYLRVQEKIIRYGFYSCGFAIVNFVLSILLVVVKGMNWNGCVYALLICTVVFGVLGFTLLLRSKVFSRHVKWNGVKMIVLWGLPLIPHLAASWIKQGCDRFIINETHSIEDVGVFSFALTLTSIIIMIGTAFNATNSVSIYQILSSDVSSQEKIEQLKHQTKNIGIIYTLGYVFVLVFGSLLVPFFLPKYVGSLPYFWITSFSGYLNCLYLLFVNYLFYYHRNKNIMKITFLTALLHLGLSLLFTRYSLYYTAVIYVVSQLVVLILIINQSFQVIREEIIKQN